MKILTYIDQRRVQNMLRGRIECRTLINKTTFIVFNFVIILSIGDTLVGKRFLIG